MKKLLLLLLAITACSYFGAKAQDADLPYVHCLVLDKTRSMLGEGDGKTNIWNDVQNYCYGMIDGISENSIVVFFTFDKDLSDPKIFEINSKQDLIKVKDAVRNVNVDGDYTWISSSIDKVVDYMYGEYKDNNKMIYLITDGNENQPGRKNLQYLADALGKYNSYKGEYDHLYYVDLRNSLRQDQQDLLDKYNIPHGSGFATFVTLSPDFATIPYEIKHDKQEERSFSVTQLFSVTKGPWVDGLTITADIPNNDVPNVNLNINRSKAEMKNGKYEVEFVVEVVSNTNMPECIIPVNIMGSEIQKAGNTVKLNVEPSSFYIKVTKEHIEPIHQKIETNGWN